MKDLIKGAIVLTIGGTVYSVSQGDIIQNFSKDTGLSQQAAQEYVESVAEDELVPFGEIGSQFILEGEEVLSIANDMDCINYTYEWESESLSCAQGKSQLTKFAKDSISLGKSYQKLDADSATEEDIASTIKFIDVLNDDFSLEVIVKFLDYEMIDENKKTNSYNKALLQAALDSN